VQTPVGGPQSSTIEQHNERVEAWWWNHNEYDNDHRH
jgi:hypothetical protein